jgi:hypothetical protein
VVHVGDTIRIKPVVGDARDDFGGRLALDGDTLAVGAVGDDSAGSDPADNSLTDSGAVHVYVREGDTWAQQAYLKSPNPTLGGGFGWSLALKGDRLLVGAPDDSPEAVYEFVRSGGNWELAAEIRAANADPGDNFGYSVALVGDSALIGAPDEDSGATVVNGDETNNSATGAGAAYLFVRADDGWEQTTYFKASNAWDGDRFGFPVALSGSRVAVSARGEDSAATGIDGDEGDNSAEFSGAVYVFQDTTDGWEQEAYVKSDSAEPNQLFGTAIFLTDDTLIVGASSDDRRGFSAGAVHAFSRSTGQWLYESEIGPTGSAESRHLGQQVLVEGATLLASAPSFAQLFRYERVDTTWSFLETIDPPSPAFSENFGSALAMVGSTVAVGATGTSFETGAVFLLTLE